MEISDLQRLRGILEIQTPGLFSPSPNLYSWRISDHLEISFIRVELARVSVIQWGTPFSGKFRSTRFESRFGNLDLWVVLTVARSIIWYISQDDWTPLVVGPNYWGFHHSSRAWHFPAWRLSISTAQIYLIQSSLYIQPWRLILYCRENFVPADIYCLYDHLRLMPDRPSIVLILHCS